MPRFDAIIFDMDGVLADSEPRYHRAINAVLAHEGVQLSDREYGQLIGLGVEATWEAIIQRYGLTQPLSEYLRRYGEAVLWELRQPAQPNPGVPQLIAAARQRRLRLGLASSSLRLWIEALLEGIGLADAFDAIVSAGMVERTKPAPDLFLLAARKLGVEPRRCLVIEDSPAGIQAAQAAGMFAVALRTPSTAGLDISNADLALDSLAQFDLSLLD